MAGFFEEIKRRKVYRVAVAYAVVAGGLIQLASAIFPAWELPAWALRLVIVLLLVGFPISLILAWALEVTPEGIRTTPPPPSTPRRRRNVIALLAAGVVISACAGFFLLPRASARKIDKSIAVLPFENFSDDKENAYFADGIQDDILTNLSKIGDLKVISRTSVMEYRGKSKNVREIGKALGVANILEGSVRRFENKVRVTVQLIDAIDDKHIWAQEYNGELTDVFKIQSDLARQIADNLQAQLSPAEKEQMQRKPTENGEAYLAFVRAHDVQSSAYEDLEKLKLSEQMYERAIALDPNFALAYARYSQLQSWIVHTFERTPARREKARSLAERAIQLRPDLPEAHLALGFVNYYVDNNFDAAAREFEIAQRGLPNESEVYLAMGAIQRRQGKWAESNANLEKAVALDPKNIWAMQNLAFNYEMQRNFIAANQMLDRALAIDPKAIGPLEIKAKVAVEETGDLSVAEKLLAVLATVPQTPEVQSKLAADRINLLLFQRKFDEAARAAEKLPDATVSSFPGALCGKYVLVGIVKKTQKDETTAREFLLKAKTFAENEIKQDSNDAAAHARLAQVLAWLGDKDAALAEIGRARALLPESKDAFAGPDITVTAAEIHAILGDAGEAVTLLEGLLQRPSTITVPVLKINPIWDPIRNDARFQSLLEKYGAKA